MIIKKRAKRKIKYLIEKTCQVCGKKYKGRRDRPSKYCSKKCNGVIRGQEWKKHAHKGRAAWTANSTKSYLSKMTGEKNPAWKGGVTYFRKHGNYSTIKYIRCPKEFLSMARKDGYVMEHRLIMAISLNRCLLKIEVVHHNDHDPKNNRLENLKLFRNNRIHKLYEGRQRLDADAQEVLAV